MRKLLRTTAQDVVFDHSNVVFRATAVAGDNYLQLYLRMIAKYRKRFVSHRFVVAVEGQGTKNRRKLFPDYKNGRAPSDFDVLSRKMCLRAMKKIGCRVVKAPKGEADDAIGCYVRQNSKKVLTIVSEDRDLWQLIVPGRVLVYTKKHGLVTPELCRQYLGVPPSMVPLQKSLLGDKSDGLPRVPRVREDQLLRLLEGAKSLTDVFQAMKEVEWLSKKDQQTLLRCKKQIRLNFRLATIDRDLEMNVRDFQPDREKLLGFLHRHDVSLENETVDRLLGEGT